MSPYMMRVLRGKAVRQMARRVERALSSNHGEEKTRYCQRCSSSIFTLCLRRFQVKRLQQVQAKHHRSKALGRQLPRIPDLYNRSGCVLLTNPGLCAKTKDAMQKWSNVLMPSTMKYEGGANSREALNLNLNNVYETGAPLSAYLHYHHEMAYVKESVDRLCFMAVNVPEDPVEPLRGASYLSDNLKVTDYLLTTEMGQKLKKYGICYIRCLTDKEGMANSQL